MGSAIDGGVAPSTKHASTEAAGASFPISPLRVFTKNLGVDFFTIKMTGININSIEYARSAKLHNTPNKSIHDTRPYR